MRIPLGRSPSGPAAPRGRPPAPARPQGRHAAHQPDLVRRDALERSRGRLVLAAGGFALLFGAVSAKLLHATLLDPREPRGGFSRVQRPSAPAPQHHAVAARGTITDRNGEVLAVNLPVTALYANPREIIDVPAAADALVRALPQLDRELLTRRLSGTNQFAYIARALTPAETQRVNDLGVPGIYFEVAERRFYPQGRAASHVLGNVDVDGNGVSGVERFFDERLRLRRGDSLRLSLDIRVQLAMRDAVLRAIAEYNGIGGVGILLDIHTSEVIAMVSLPDYDASDIGAATPEQRFNRATVGVYEPGSTFKLLTAAMALEAGTVNLGGGYDASRPIRIGRFTISDYRGKGRWLALPEILAYSSNIASAHMAAAVGPTRQREFMARMGMLSRQQIELPETAGTLAPPASSWREINTFTIGFGHGISVTPLHVINGVAALANGGVLRDPTLIAQPPGTVREGRRVVSERTSDLIRRFMRLVVTEGSAKAAEVPGYFVGGKTGTAQKTGPRGGYLADKRIAAFAGAFPINAPRYALYVMVDEPKPNARSHGFATAGWVAAPAASAVIARVAPILGMVPDDPRSPEANAALAMPLQPPRGRPVAPAAANTAPATSPSPGAAPATRPAAATAAPPAAGREAPAPAAPMLRAPPAAPPAPGSALRMTEALPPPVPGRW